MELLSGVGVIAAIALEQAIRIERLETEKSLLQHDLDIRYDLVGRSASMMEVFAMIDKVAPANSTVLARALFLHIGQEPAHHIELVEARPDLHGFLAAGLLVFGLDDLRIVLEDVAFRRGCSEAGE